MNLGGRLEVAIESTGEDTRVGRLMRLVNPFTTIVESSRQMLIYGQLPDPLAMAGMVMVCCAVALAGYVFFVRTRRYFADAL